jgi:hypothetical protein
MDCLTCIVALYRRLILWPLLIDCGNESGCKTRGRRASRRVRWCADPLFCVLSLWRSKTLFFRMRFIRRCDRCRHW